MLGTIFGIEIVMIEKKLQFSLKRTRDNTYIHSSFLNFNHAWNDLNFTNCELALVFSCFDYSCYNQKLLSYIFIRLVHTFGNRSY